MTLDEVLRHLVLDPSDPDWVPLKARKGQPWSMARKARETDQEVWRLFHEEGLSLTKARKVIVRTRGKSFDHVRKYQQLALQLALDDMAEAAMERMWKEEAEARLDRAA